MIIVTVEQLAGHVKMLLESDPLLTDVWVSGEISNLSRPTSGHCYFTLKDGAAQIRSAMFKQKARAAYRTALQHGAQVLAHGYVSFYEARGDLQFYVDAVQPAGVGVLQAEFERRYARLEAEGLFAAERKRPLPPFPRRIGVVTSETGAVFHDICHVIGRRWPLLQIVLAPTRVQGDGAADGMADAIAGLNRVRDIDVIIVARGGGSLEDLWAFNEERVVRAIYASRIPVISAVGHETDYTIADAVADVRAPTPSAAAEIVAPDQIEFAARIGGCQASLEAFIRDSLNERYAGVEDAAADLLRSCPNPSALNGKLAVLRVRLERQLQHGLALRVERLEGWQRHLAALSPRRTLERGYAIVHAADGSLLESATNVRAGQRLGVHLHDGGFEVRVEPQPLPPRSSPSAREVLTATDAQQTRLW